MLPAMVIAEQAVYAWKWRQLLLPLRPIETIYLFGAIMAGYLLATLVPFRAGTIARSWLVARRESLKLASVLATVALDRLSDDIVFVCLIPIVLLLVAFPDPVASTAIRVAGVGFSIKPPKLLAARKDGEARFGSCWRKSCTPLSPSGQYFRANCRGVLWSRPCQRNSGGSEMACPRLANCENEKSSDRA